MFRLDRIYRTNYVGESVTTQARFQDSEWSYATEWVPTSVINRQTSRVAAIIGNGLSRKDFELYLLTKHMAGRLATGSMQTYGCNAVYRDAEPTFMIATGDEFCQEIVDSGYCDSHIVYANANKVMKYPGKFYLVPQDVPSNSGTIATYLACFDGHEKIYLVGFDGWGGDNFHNNIYSDTANYPAATQHINDDYWVQSMIKVMETYSEVEFVRCMPTKAWRCPDAWLALPNFRQISYRDFVLEADL